MLVNLPLGICVTVTGNNGHNGHNVLLLVVEENDTGLERFGTKISQNAWVLINVPAATWVFIFQRVIQYATTVLPQVDFAVVKMDGMENVATTVCMMFLWFMTLKFMVSC